MSKSVFDLLETELALLQGELRHLARAKSGAIMHADFPARVPKALTAGKAGAALAKAAALWFCGAIAVLNRALANPEVILSRGVRCALENPLAFQVKARLDPVDRQFVYHCALDYGRRLADRLAPERLDALAGRKLWIQQDIRAALYRRLEIERSGRLAMEKAAKEDRSLSLLWERDGARYQVFHSLCASTALMARAPFLQELEALRVHPTIPTEVVDREGYRLAWLSAIQEIKEEVLEMKPKQPIPHTPPSQPSIAPDASNGTPSGDVGQAPQTDTAENKGEMAAKADVVELSLEGVDWTDEAVFLGDEKERSYITRFQNAYGDFFRALPYCDLQTDPSTLLGHAKSLVNITGGIIAIWNDLEGYRLSHLRKVGKNRSRSDLKAASKVIADKVKFCLSALNTLAVDCRRRPIQERIKTPSLGRYFEVSTFLERELGHLTDLIDQRLEKCVMASRQMRTKPPSRSRKPSSRAHRRHKGRKEV